MKRISSLLVLSMFTIVLSAQAATDHRRQLPAAFKKSYIGFSGGWLNIPFTQSNLEPSFTASEVEIPHFAPRIFIGHFFNPHIAVQLSLMRPVKWIHFKGVQSSNDEHSVWISLFGITARPTVALSKNIALYANVGLGLISRHGFKIGNDFAVTNALIPTLLTGGGLTYAFNQHWHADLGFSYTPENHHKKQPHIIYVYTGFYYLLSPNASNDSHPKNRYIFPLNFIQAGFFTNELFHANVNKYVTEGYLPIFWDGKVKNRNGVYLMYERNFFHTDRSFSLEWGASMARYQTHLDGQIYYTFSLFPALKVWIVRTRYIDFYFTYSVAGPTYITQDHLDRIDAGTHFTFQDFMGIGFFLGRNKNINVNLKIAHYSNGNTFPMNAGIEVPLTIAIGFAFN